MVTAQRDIDPTSQTPLENIDANAAILRNLNAAKNNIVDELQLMATEQARNQGY